jgi:hypothetical protein
MKTMLQCISTKKSYNHTIIYIYILQNLRMCHCHGVEYYWYKTLDFTTQSIHSIYFSSINIPSLYIQDS